MDCNKTNKPRDNGCSTSNGNNNKWWSGDSNTTIFDPSTKRDKEDEMRNIAAPSSKKGTKNDDFKRQNKNNDTSCTLTTIQPQLVSRIGASSTATPTTTPIAMAMENEENMDCNSQLNYNEMDWSSNDCHFPKFECITRGLSEKERRKNENTKHQKIHTESDHSVLPLTPTAPEDRTFDPNTTKDEKDEMDEMEDMNDCIRNKMGDIAAPPRKKRRKNSDLKRQNKNNDTLCPARRTTKVTPPTVVNEEKLDSSHQLTDNERWWLTDSNFPKFKCITKPLAEMESSRDENTKNEKIDTESGDSTLPTASQTDRTMGILKGYQVFLTDKYIHQEEIYNKSLSKNNSYILTKKRSKLLVNGYVRKYTKSIQMDIASVVKKYYGNDSLIVDIRHPPSLFAPHATQLSKLLFDLDGILMTTYSEGNKIIDGSSIEFSIELLGESKCKAGTAGIGLSFRGYARNEKKSTYNEGEHPYFTKEDHFDNIDKTGEATDDYDCKHNLWDYRLSRESEIYKQIGNCFDARRYALLINPSNFSFCNEWSEYIEKEKSEDGWEELKFGESIVYATINCENKTLIFERKDNGEKRHIHSCKLMEDKFYVFVVELTGCSCKNIDKHGMMYSISIKQK